jgi:hypothetical protein
MPVSDDPQSSPTAAPVPGWYADPAGVPDRLRYWDGARWTDDFHPPAVAQPAAATAREPARRLQPYAICAIAGLAVVAVFDVFAVFTALDARALIERALDGGVVTGREARDMRDRVGDLDLGLLFGYIAAAFVFIPWFFQARKNLDRVGVATRHGSGWAIGAWFVPLLNLIRPKQIADDIYRGSGREARSGAPIQGMKTPSFVHWWWATFLLSGVMLRVTIEIRSDEQTQFVNSLDEWLAVLERESTSWTVFALGSVIELVAAILAIVFVARVTAAQRELTEGPAAATATRVAPAIAPATSQGSTPAATTGIVSQSPPGWNGPL